MTFVPQQIVLAENKVRDIYVGLFGRYAFRGGSRVYYIYFFDNNNKMRQKKPMIEMINRVLLPRDMMKDL